MNDLFSIGQQPVAQIPWGHNLVILNNAQRLPDEFKSSLPSIDEIEAELGGGE